MFSIRPLQKSDIPRLIEINPAFTAHSVLRVYREGKEPFVHWRLEEEPLETPFEKGSAYDFDDQERRLIQERLAQDNTLLEVVENTRTRRLVGILDVEEERWRKTAWVWNIMLDVEARGRGLGRRLMTHAIEWAAERGLRAVMLETQTNNTPACHFYAHFGFKLVGINEQFYTNNDIAREEVALFWSYPLP